MKNIKSYKLIIALIVLILLLAAAFHYSTKNKENNVAPPITSPATPTKPSVPEKNKLAETEWVWKYTEFSGGTERVIAPAGEKFVLVFEPEGTMTSSTDCNSLGGKYVISGSKLSFSSLVSTLMACSGKTFESEYSKELSQAASFKINNNELQITLDNDGMMVFGPKVELN